MWNGLLLIVSMILLVSTLQHEKSFVYDNTASSSLDIALYNHSLLITAANDIVQKDIETGSVQRKFIAHSGQIQKILVVNGSTMITAAWDDMIIVWDLISGSIVRRISLEGSSTYPSGIQLMSERLLVCGKDGKVRIVNMLSGIVAQIIDVSASANDIVVNENSFIVGKTQSLSTLDKYYLSNGGLQLSYVGHQSTVLALLLWNDMLFSGSVDTTVICWNEINGQIIRTYNGHTGEVQVVSLYENHLYSAGRPYSIIKWNIDSGIIEKVFSDEHFHTIMCLTSGEGSLFSGSLDTTVVRWDLSTSEKIFIYSGRNIRLWCLALWKNFVVAGGESLVLRIIHKTQNSVSPVEIMSGHSNDVGCMLVLGDTLFSGSIDSTIRRRSLIDFADISIYYGHTSTISTLVFGDNVLYSGSNDNTIKSWNISSGSIYKDYVGHEDRISSIQFRSPFLFSASDDYTLRVWDKDSAIVIKIIGDEVEISVISLYDEYLIAGGSGVAMISLSTSEILAKQEETSLCTSIAGNQFRIYSGQDSGLIFGRDVISLFILESFTGHKDYVRSISLDDVGALFSTGFDGSVKKWDMFTRKISFSFEDRNGSVTALAAANGKLFVATLEGVLNVFDIGSTYLISSRRAHEKTVTFLASIDNTIYSTGMDGIIYSFSPFDSSDPLEVYNSFSVPVTAAGISLFHLLVIKDENEMLILERMNSSRPARSLYSPLPIKSITANDEMIFAGSRAGSIDVYNVTALEKLFFLDDHTSQVNFLLVQGSSLYSASNDKTIIKWSLDRRIPSFTFKRLSSTALGHLGPVNSISICGGTLFSAGSDLTTRRWNTQTGRHEDVYFGPTKSLTSVVCYNGSVFAGSEDFTVLMYSPNLPLLHETRTAARTSTKAKRGVRTRIFSSMDFFNSESPQISILVGGIVAALILIIAATIAFFYLPQRLKTKKIVKSVQTSEEFSDITTDLNTVVNTVVGISKHAVYLVENSSFAGVKKLAAGGGGEVFLARVMNSFLQEKTGTLVIQKVVFIKNAKSAEAFYQEVGIMIMLSSFPNFCRIIGYTENPSSMILKYYPDGSLQDWIHGKTFGRHLIVKLSKEISSALKIMHCYYLAHCDLKPQNVLVEVVDGIPTCYLTDFGITQVLSETILASRAFNVINLKGLSVFYAAPEAFTWFRTKIYTGVDFKKFDVYSLACVVLELLTRKTPWS